MKREKLTKFLLAGCMMIGLCVNGIGARADNNENVSSETKLQEDLYQKADSVWQWEETDAVDKVRESVSDVFLRGIDVSRWQGTIDWDLLKDSGDIDFVLIRSAHGTAADENWEINAGACAQREIPFGSYVYSTAVNEQEAVQEAECALEWLDGYDLSLPVYYDLEDSGVLAALQQQCSSQKEVRTKLAEIASGFARTIEAAGFEVGIYSNTAWWTKYLTDSVFDTSGWHKWIVGEESSVERAAEGEEEYIWQYTLDGRILGISDNFVAIDFWIDRAIGDADVFRKRVPHMTGANYQEEQKQVLLTWEDVQNEEKYLVYRKKGKDSWKQIQTLSADVTSYADKDVKVGETYYYRVQAARTCDGVEAKSDYESEYECTVGLNAPILDEAYGMADGSILLSWEKSDGANQYYIYRKNGNNSWEQIAQTDKTQYMDTTAKEGVTYSYTVRAYQKKEKRLSGCDPMGVSVTAQSLVSVLKSVSLGSGESISVSWNTVASAKKYRIYRKTGKEKWKEMAEAASNATGWQDKDVVYGTTYTYAVSVYCEHNGVGVWSDYDEKGLSITSTLAAPTLKEAYAMADGSILVSWEEVTDANQYYVYRKTGEDSWERIARVTDTQYRDENADIGTEYIYTVRAYHKDTKQLGNYDGTGVSAVSRESAPKLISTNSMEGSITFTWQAMDEAAKYAVYRREQDGEWYLLAEVNASTSSWKDTKIQARKTYYYTVRAYCEHDGVGTWSAYADSGVSAKAK